MRLNDLNKLNSKSVGGGNENRRYTQFVAPVHVLEAIGAHERKHSAINQVG